MRILALGGVHGDEKPAILVAKSVINNPISNVKGLLANLRAVNEGKRFIDVNMSDAFPGDRSSPHYEKRRAAKVMKKVEAHSPDVIVDIQSIEGGKVHAVVNLDMGVSPIVLGALWDFGVRHIVTNDLNIHSHFPNAFGLEITPDCSLQSVRGFLDSLANNPALPRVGVDKFEWFRYSEVGGGGLHASVIHPNALSPEEKKAFGSFKPLPHRIQQLLGVTEPLYAQNDLRQPNEQEYYTDLLEKTKTPDSSGWPR